MNPPHSSSHYTISNVTVVDVEAGKTLPGMNVKIAGERIDRIAPPAGPEVPERVRAIDGQGKYLMPGLVDAHVHFLDAPVFGRLMLANGVLLVRDMGMPNEFILPLRDALKRGEILGPEMVSAGVILDGDPPLLPLISRGVPTPEAGRLAVRQQAELGVDHIKVYSRLEQEVFLAIVDEARRCGLKAVGHIPETVPFEEAIGGGLASSEHFFGFEKAVGELLGEPVNYTFTGMASQAAYLERLEQVKAGNLEDLYQQVSDSGMAVCPTVVTFQTGTHLKDFQAGDFPRRELVSPMLMGIWESMWSGQENAPAAIWQNWVAMVKGLSQAGVRLMVGTDLMLPGIIPGYAVHEEMALWQQAGISPAEVLRSATLVPAQFMGQGDRLGSVSEGKIASLLLVRGNPLEDVRNAQQIEGVFLRGKYYNRKDIELWLEEARQAAKPAE